MADLWREAVKWREEQSDDAPVQQPMRGSTKPVQRRKPDADQKKVRREMQRKTAERSYESGSGEMYALTSGQGTAMSETFLCAKHHAHSEVREMTEAQAREDQDFGTKHGWDGRSPWHDVSGNDASDCWACGHRSLLQRLIDEHRDQKEGSMRKGAPFAGYEDFDACVAANSDKDDPKAYCGFIKHKVEDSKESSRKTATPWEWRGTPTQGQFHLADWSEECQENGSGICDGFKPNGGECGCPCHNASDLPQTYEGVKAWHDDMHGVTKESSMKTADIDRAGDRECQSCGHVGGPVLADTGPACSQCGSYSLKRSEFSHAASIDQAGDRECQACGNVGSPVLADTGPACARCGSYSLAKAPYKHPGQDDPSQSGYPSPTKSQYGRVSVRHEGTRLESNVATSDGRILINPGDQINLPTGQTTKVNQVRRHETSRDHYYVDTDAGTTVVPWSTKFELVPDNTQQQSIPGLGTPGGNFANLPMNPQAGGGSNVAPDACPVCGTKGSLNRQGDKYKCNKCGFMDNFVGGGLSFSDATQTLLSQSSRTDTRSVIARRAATVAATEKETTL